MIGVTQVKAYTVSELTSDGWEEVTSLPTISSELGKYYYVFWETQADLMLGEENGSDKGGASQENQLTGVYKTPANPATDKTKVWILEYNADNFYGIRNLSNPQLLLQSRENATYRVQAAWERIQSIWTQWGLTYADSKWSIQNKLPSNKGGGDNNWIGPWNKGAFQDNMVVAGNAGGNGNKKGLFKIYRKSRLSYEGISYDYASATAAAPLNVTALITNANFDHSTAGWNITGDKPNAFNTDYKAFEAYHRVAGVNQDIKGIPNGKYAVSVQVACRDDNGTKVSDNLPKLIATSAYHTVSVVSNESPKDNFANTAKAMNDDASYAKISVNVNVTDGNLNVALNENNNNTWPVYDNFTLFYYGPTVAGSAVVLPDGGAMAAETWYKFTPESTGGYNLNVTTLGDVVYTTDGTTLISTGSSTTFGSNPVTLSATTYYIKSSSANKFEYEIDSYDVTELVAEYETAVDNAETAKTAAEAADKVNAAEKTALDDAITTYGSVEIPADPTEATKVQKDALETATAALTDATSAVNTSITAYTNAKAYFDAVEPVLATTNFYTSAAYTANYPKAAYDAGTLSDDNAAALSYGERRDGNMPAILLSSWAGTTLYMNTWSTEAEGVAPAADFANPFFEYWVAGGNNLGANTFTSTIDGFEANTLYAVTLNARVKQRDGNRKVANSIKMKVGEEGDEVDLTQGLHIGMGRRFIDSYTAYGYTNASGELVTTITVAANSNISWLAFRDVNYARVEGASALDEVISEVTDLNGHVPTNVYNTAYTQVTAHTGVNYPTTDAEFATAISDIRSAVATAATYLDEYAGYLELKNYADALVAVTNDNPTANSTLATAISTAATDANSVANVAALTSVNTTLKDAMVTYAGAANPVGEGNKFDLTFMLGKVNFDDCISWESPAVNGFSGWATEQGDGNFQVMENASKTSGDYHSFMEYWSWNAKANDEFNLYTTVESLPVGTYTMSCYAFAVQQDGEAGKTPVPGLYFYANDTQGGVVNDNRLTQKSISFVNDNVQDVKIGLKPVSTGNTYNWMGIGYVELYKVPEQVYELNEATAWDHTQSGAGNVEITRTIKVGVNTVVFPFSMNQTEVEDYFGAGSVVYQLSSYEDETIHFITRSGISANEPCLVKATSTTNSAVAYTLNDRTVVAAASASPSVAGTNVTMTGTYAASTSVDQGNYIVSGSNIYLVNSDNVKMKNTRAYITLGTPNLGARLAIIFDEEDPTAINTIEAAESEAGALKDGKYLIEGKIVIVKNGVKYDANGKKLN